MVSDVGEWTSIPHKCKLKFVVFVDAATKLRVAEPLFRCEISEMKTETGLQLVEAFSKRWLSDKPKPEIFIRQCEVLYVQALPGLLLEREHLAGTTCRGRGLGPWTG